MGDCIIKRSPRAFNYTMVFRRDEKFIYLAVTREERLADFGRREKLHKSCTPSAARFAQLYQLSPPRSSRIALFEMDPCPSDPLLSSPSPRLSHSPSARILRQLFHDNARSISATAIHAPVVATLGHAPWSLDPTSDTSFLVCAEEFFEDNPLTDASLQHRTRHVNAVALENFRGSAFACGSYALFLEQRIFLYIQDCFTRNPKPGKRQEMVNLLSILHLMIPSLRGNHLGLSKRCLTG